MPVAGLSLPAGHNLTAAEAARIAEATQPWQTYTPTITGVTTSSNTARWHRHGDKVTVEFRFVLSAVPTAAVVMSLPVTGTSALSFSIPAPRGVMGGVQGANAPMGFVYLDSASTAAFVTAAGTNWSASVPNAWSSGAAWGGHFEYEAA